MHTYGKLAGETKLYQNPPLEAFQFQSLCHVTVQISLLQMSLPDGEEEMKKLVLARLLHGDQERTAQFTLWGDEIENEKEKKTVLNIEAFKTKMLRNLS